jgi:CHAT domain-containing protein/Flp pilus assembly protein TadD
MRSIIVVLWLICACKCVYSQAQINHDSLGTALKLKAAAEYTKGNIVEATRYYQQAYKLFLKSKNTVKAAWTMSSLAAVDFNAGQYSSAVTKGRKALDLLKHRSNDTIAFFIQSDLATSYEFLYRRDSADYFVEQAEKLLTKSKLVANSEDAPFFYLNRGAFANNRSDFKKAQSYLLQALQLGKKYADFDLGVLYNNLATSYYIQNDFIEAQKYYQLALQQKSTITTLSTFGLNLASCYIQLNKLELANTYIQKAWKSYKESSTTPNLVYEQNYYVTLGWYFKEKHQWARALDSYQKSLKMNEGISKKGASIGKVFLRMSTLYDAQNQPRKALEFYQKALNAAHETFNSTSIYQNPALDRILTERELFRALMGKANAFRQLHTQTRQRRDLEAALKTYQLAIQLAEKMRRSYQSAGAKLFFTENYYAVYEQAIQTAQELYQLTQKPDYQNLIFDFCEKSRAASLSDIVREADLKPKTINAALLAQEKGLYQQITGLQAALKRADSTTAVKLKAQLVDKEIELDRLTKRFEREFPAYYQLKYDTKTASATTIQQQLLSPDAALIQYFLTSTQLYILVLTREHSKVVVQPIDSTFRQTVSKFRELLSLNPGSKVYDGSTYSSTLYSKLIAPALPFISTKKRLLIVRDAELNYVPFEVLAAKPNDYLLKRYAISYAYSVGLLMNLSSPRSSNNRLSIAPFAGNISQKATFRGAPLVPLPASEEEVRQIGGDVYVEKEATKKRFLEQYREHGIIHFATHALTDDKDPMRSFVAFYPDGQEYRLFTNELYDLDLKEAQLVVLSACETGAGRLQRGEGVMSLARAFAYAGAQSVATTLWNANDEATAYISTHFHEYINDGLPLDEALQRAKLDFLKSDLGRRYDHPYYWANMVLIGRTDPIEKDTVLWWWMVVGLFVLGVMGLWFRKLNANLESK